MGKQKGKWLSELAQLKQIAQELKSFKADVCAKQDFSPAQFMQSIDEKLKAIEQTLAANTRHSFFDHRLSPIEQLLKQCRAEFNALHPQVAIATATAAAMGKSFQTVLERTSKAYLEKQPLFYSGAHSGFESLLTAEFSTWSKLSPKLQYLSTLASFDKREHNVLAKIVLTSNEEFIDLINDGNMPFSTELGFLAIQRLREIQKSKTSSRLMVTTATRTINQLMNTSWPESLLKIDVDALVGEIAKLVLHANLHPEQKNIWLGSARTVRAVINNKAGNGAYLNCEDEKWTWLLNRTWLQAALKLGYNINLVEQHFPEIEAALLSQDSAKLITELVREMRSNDGAYVSQYNGIDSPTATPQEMLVLMDTGCVANKNEDNSLTFSARTSARDLQETVGRTVDSGKYHEAPTFFRAAPLPPLASREEHFNIPKSSVAIRKGN